MGIGGEMRFSAITRANFSRIANACGVSPKLVLSRLDALCGRITTRQTPGLESPGGPVGERFG